MSIEFDLATFRRQLGKTQAQIAAATRPAAQAGAQVIYESAKARVPVSKEAHYFHIRGKKYGPFAPGNLRDSVYQTFSADNSGPNKAEYHISWNFRKAPYGFMVHNGTSRTPAHPFIATAMHDQREAAERAMKQRFVEEMAK